MRGDLQKVLRGETISDVVQLDLPKTQVSFPDLEIPLTQKSVPISVNNFQAEPTKFFHPVPIFDETERHKNFNSWIYATIGLVLIGAVGIGIYFFANQSRQIDSNLNQITQLTETQAVNKSSNSENVNVLIISNSNIDNSTPKPTPVSYSGSYEYKKGDYWGNLKINEIGKTYPKPFKFSIDIGRVGRCTGAISGIAKWIKNNIAIASIKNEGFDPSDSYGKPFCQVTFNFSSKKVKVSQDSCNYYHGAECDFEGTYKR